MIMGASMCTHEGNRTRNNFLRYQFTEVWHASEEDSNDEKCPNFARAGKMKSLPKDFGRTLVRSPPIERAKSETLRKSGYSLEAKMKQYHRSSSVDREGEKQAEQYSKMVADDTLNHLQHTVRIASSIVQKGADINEELDRQQHVLCKSHNTMSIADYETEETAKTLKGMSTLRNKFAINVKRKKLKEKPKAFSEFDIELLEGKTGLCAISRMCNNKSSPPLEDSPKCAQQRQIQAGMGHLHKALDEITVQQLDAAWTLQRQNERLAELEEKMTTTHKKVNRQSRIMTKIILK